VDSIFTKFVFACPQQYFWRLMTYKVANVT